MYCLLYNKNDLVSYSVVAEAFIFSIFVGLGFSFETLLFRHISDHRVKLKILT